MTPIRIALAILLLQAGQANRQPAVAGSVEGIAVDRVMGAPIPGVTVEISGIVKTNVEVFSAKTDKAGMFVIRNLPSGVPFWLTASLPGSDRRYIPTVYRQRGIAGPGSQITLQPNQHVTGVRLQMIPTVTISGRIVNEKGKPMEKKSVYALSPYNSGGPWAPKAIEFRTSGTLPNVWRVAQTNSRGEYQITGLPPGQYYVNVAGKPGIADTFIPQYSKGLPTQLQDYGFSDYYASTYFPGTTDPWSAARLDLLAGSTKNNVDIQISPVSYRRIRGTVIDDATGMRVSSAQLMIVPRDAPPDSRRTRNISLQKGAFEYGAIPGSYFLVAFANEAGQTYFGRTAIEVGKDPIDNISVRVSSGFRVTGRIFSGSSEADARSAISNVFVTLRPNPPSEPGILPPPTQPDLKRDLRDFQAPGVLNDGFIRSAVALPAAAATSDSDGRVNLAGVASWHYTVEVKTSLEEFYVKSIRMGSRDVFRDDLQLDMPPAGILEIELGRDAGSLDGRVADERSKPMDNIRVILVPADARPNRADRFKVAWTGPVGNFRMIQIPPGDYTLYAWENTEDDAWRDPEFLRLYKGRGTPVHIRARTAEHVETRVIPPWF